MIFVEKQSKYLIILLIAFVICIGVFIYQFNNDVATFIIINTTEVEENGTIAGMLMDAYGNGVANKTITFHKPGYEFGTIGDTTTDENGEFIIENAEYLPGAGSDNYYGDFEFGGDDKYLSCTYEGNVTVIAN